MNAEEEALYWEDAAKAEWRTADRHMRLGDEYMTRARQLREKGVAYAD